MPPGDGRSIISPSSGGSMILSIMMLKRKQALTRNSCFLTIAEWCRAFALSIEMTRTSRIARMLLPASPRRFRYNRLPSMPRHSHRPCFQDKKLTTIIMGHMFVDIYWAIMPWHFTEHRFWLSAFRLRWRKFITSSLYGIIIFNAYKINIAMAFIAARHWLKHCRRMYKDAWTLIHWPMHGSTIIYPLFTAASLSTSRQVMICRQSKYHFLYVEINILKRATANLFVGIVNSDDGIT